MSASAPPPGTALGSIDALKRVKATESEWEAKLGEVRRATQEVLERLRAESEATVTAARSAADAERTRVAQAARAEAEGEAEVILATGRAAAEAALRGDGKRPGDQTDSILAVVLAGFAKD